MRPIAPLCGTQGTLNFADMSMTASGKSAIDKRAPSNTYQAFVDTSEAHSVNLTDVGGLCLKELLECDSVLSHFSSRHAYIVGLEGFANGSMAQNIVWIRRFCSMLVYSSSPKEEYIDNHLQ